MARVLIAGCGYTGIALGMQLASEQHTVWGLRRRPELLPAAIHPLKADLCDPGSLTLIPPKLDFVFYTAAAERTDDASYQAAYVTGIQNAPEPAVSITPKPWKDSSSLPALQSTRKPGGEWVDETSETFASGVFPDEGSWKEKSCSCEAHLRQRLSGWQAFTGLAEHG
jgi:2-polyprenyl-6-methoxyphenol hydroxylase-like FAD-dependent oxidoreductase